ncbi:hypothetical protein ZEAMMB73_Zm00001d019910 [Zea mays]|uniref:Uncharacterized protein n=1 Tax=Zea mays TaxID=4577 RepID=A0A1D6I0Z1_MAIZE|nr:hypothetical protein ZEAMMB73_Zm00001d019910 [Zea mays]
MAPPPRSFFLGALKLSPMAASSSFSHGAFPCSSLLGQQPGRPKPLCSASFFHLRPTSTFLLHGCPAAAPLSCSTASSSSSTSSSHSAQKFQQQGLPLLHSSSSSTLLSSLAQTSPMARCSRRPGASPPWLATRLPPCLCAAAQCPVGACYVLDEMRSKPRVVDFLQQPRRLRALRARYFIKRSEQHAVDTSRLFAVFAQPRRRRSPPERNPCFAWRRRQAAQRSLDVRSYAQIKSPTFLQTPIGFVYGQPMHVALD